jgi:hypothetical protein
MARDAIGGCSRAVKFHSSCVDVKGGGPEIDVSITG